VSFEDKKVHTESREKEEETTGQDIAINDVILTVLDEPEDNAAEGYDDWLRDLRKSKK